MNSLTTKLIESGSSVKRFRGALLEASQSFVPGSAADLIYRFYQVASKHYKDLLVYEFQLYSDRPKEFFNLTHVVVSVNSLEDSTEKRLSLDFKPGNGDFVSAFKALNDYPAEAVGSVVYSFILNPELKNLEKEIENTLNKSSFLKLWQPHVNRKDGSCDEGTFTPEWKDNGLTLTLSAIRRNFDKETDYIRYGGIY